MSDISSDIEQPKRRRGPGRPFPPGKSPNPGGRPGGRKYHALDAELTVELGGDLPPTKRLLVEQFARLKLRAKVDDVRTARAMTMIMRALGIEQLKPAKTKPVRSSIPSLDEIRARRSAE
jgi:hypothetical protein